MITITNDYGTFEAETEREAMKMLRQAKREAALKQKRDDANYAIAKTRAQSVGYWILCRRIEGIPPGWRLIQPGVNHAPAIEHIGTYHYAISPETEHGRARLEFYRQRILGLLENGSGFHLAIFTEDTHTGAQYAFAIGAAEDQRYLAPLPGVTAAEFEKRRDAE